MKDFLEYLVKNLVDHPDQVQVKEENDSDSTNLFLSVAQEDMGKVIGKQGKIIHALRDLVRILAIKQNLRSNLVLREG